MLTTDFDFLSFLGWTHYSHGDSLSNRFREAVPVFEFLDDALHWLDLQTIKQQEMHHKTWIDHAAKTMYEFHGNSNPDRIWYRGQANVSWNFLPTGLRDVYNTDFKVERLAELYRRTHEVLEMLAVDASREVNFSFFKDLSYVQRLALVRHFGFPSLTMDVTSDPKIAAHFACGESSTSTRQKIGLIYAVDLSFLRASSLGVSMNKLEQQSGHAVVGSSTRTFRVTMSKLRFEDNRTAKRETFSVVTDEAQFVAPSLVTVPNVKRIEAQAAAFLDTVANNLSSHSTIRSVGELGRTLTTWQILELFASKVGFMQTEHNSDMFHRSQKLVCPIEAYEPLLTKRLQ